MLSHRRLDGTGPEGAYLRFLYNLPPLRRDGQVLLDVFEKALVRQGITVEEGSFAGSGGSGDGAKDGERRDDQGKKTTSADDGRRSRRVDEPHYSSPRHGRRAVNTEDDTDVRPLTRRSSFSDFLVEERRAQPRVRAVSRTSDSRLQHHPTGSGARVLESRNQRAKSHVRSKSEEQRWKDLPRTANEERAKNRSRHEKTAKSRENEDRRPPERITSTRFAVQQRTARTDQRPGIDSLITKRELNREALRRLEQWAQFAHERGGGDQDSARHRREEPSSRAIPPQERQQYAVLAEQVDEPEGQQDEDEALFELPRPSRAQLERDARTFDRFRIQDLSRTLISKWHVAAEAQKVRLGDIYTLATRLDREALLRQAFRRWNQVTILRKHLRSAEAHYRALEERAVRFRTFQLLAKSFTHWTERGSEERARTQAARRHILRLKYFSVWKDLTLVNQHKVRGFVLHKFFAVWKLALVGTLRDSNRALVLRREHLVQTAYWAWFWRFCGERAPQWRDGVLRRRYLSRWTAALQQRRETDAQAALIRSRILLQKHLEAWRAKSLQTKQQEAQAVRFQREQTISRALPPWRLQLRLAPAARQTQGMRERRVVAQAFDAWRKRTFMARQAARVDQWRIVHGAWTAWNDNLRVVLMHKQRAERAATAALYRWVLAERAVHFERAWDAQRCVSALGAAIVRWREKQSRLQDAHEKMLAARDGRLLKQILEEWRQARHAHDEQARRAVAFEKPRATHRLLEEWCNVYNRNLALTSQAASARRYLLLSHALQSWRFTASASRKQKLQAAYAAVRIRHKKNAARHILQTWFARTSHVLELVDEAENLLHGRLWNLAHATLWEWASALQDLRRADVNAVSQRKESLLRGAMVPWAEKGGVLATQKKQAEAFARSGAEKLAYECLRRMQLRRLESVNLDAKATTVRSWAERRRARALLGIWAERARERRRGDGAGITTTGGPRRLGMFSASATQGGGAFSISQHNRPPEQDPSPTTNDWASDFPPPPHQIPARELEATLSPLPAYLSTPSKRAARVKAFVVDVPSFTPRTEPRTMPIPARAVGVDASATNPAPPARGLGLRSVADFGRASAAGIGERSMIPTAAGTHPGTPLVRSLFRKRMGTTGGGTELGRSLGPVGRARDDE